MDIQQVIVILLLWGLFFGNEEQRNGTLLFINSAILLYVSGLLFQIILIFVEPDYIYGICFMAIFIYLIWF